MFINNPGHMTKMTTMPIYGKNPSKFFFSRTTGPISTKLGMKHRGLEYYNVFINHDLWMALTYFRARSTKVARAFEWGKLLKCHLKGKSCRTWANGLKVGNSEKNLDPRGWSAPTQGQYTCILQKYTKIFFSETTWPIKAQFYRKHLWEGGINVFINNPGHMTKMAAMPTYGKNPLKFFS